MGIQEGEEGGTGLLKVIFAEANLLWDSGKDWSELDSFPF